jgi:hypothetical protein
MAHGGRVVKGEMSMSDEEVTAEERHARQLVWSTRHGYYVPRWQAEEEDRIAAIAYDEARRRRQDECPHEWW